MLEAYLPTLTDELLKLAASHAEVFHAQEKKDWGALEKALRKKKEREAFLAHDKTRGDPQLAAYASAWGAYLSSKKKVGSMPSRSSKKTYALRELPGGRVGCGCKDWQYKHAAAGSDCDHVQLWHSMQKTKVAASAVASLIRGAKHLNDYHQNLERLEKGKRHEYNFRQLQRGSREFVPLKG